MLLTDQAYPKHREKKHRGIYFNNCAEPVISEACNRFRCGAGAIGLFWLRAGSIHAPLDRFWRLVFGKAEVHDPVIKALLQESRDIERYNCSFRPKARSIGDIHKIDNWRKSHGLGMSDLRKVSRWIDVDLPELLRQPTKKYIPVCVIVAILAYLAMLGIAPLGVSRYAYFQARDSNVWFKTDTLAVKAPLEGWSFDAANCTGDKAAISKISGLNHSEVDLLCTGLSANEFKQEVNQALTSQKMVGGGGMLIAFVIVLISVLFVRSAGEALRLRKRLSPMDETSVQIITPGCNRANASSAVPT